MAKVSDLQPGDLVTQEVPGGILPESAVFITKAPHPGYKGLQLVIWKLSDGTWSFDALLPEQEIGEIRTCDGQEKGMRLLLEVRASVRETPSGEPNISIHEHPGKRSECDICLRRG